VRDINENSNTYQLCLLVWFCARGSNRAGQFVNPDGSSDCAKGIKAREEFDAWWRNER